MGSQKPNMVAPPVARQLSVQAVVDAVLEHGSITRTQLASITGLSKQTMSEVVRDLERDGWLKVSGQATGSVGRRAVIYEFREDACYILGVDLGGSNLRAALASLNGNIAAEHSEETDRRGGAHVIEQVAGVADRLLAESKIDRQKLRMGVIAVSGILQHSTGAILAASNIPGINDIDFAGLMEERLALPLFVENAVDVATRGERWQGRARGLDNFVFIGHGAGIGLGAVVDGRLLKGRKGAIGEIAFLPIGGNAFDPRNFGVGTLEAEVGAAAMVRKFEGFGGFPGASVRDIFSALEKGYEPAEAVLDETARLVALAIASVAALIDPEVVIMGGQIGVHPEMIGRVRRHLSRCTPISMRVEPTDLGVRAQLIGALGAGIELAYSRIFGVSAAGSPRIAPDAWAPAGERGRINLRP